jgi:hypothetical protein
MCPWLTNNISGDPSELSARLTHRENTISLLSAISCIFLSEKFTERVKSTGWLCSVLIYLTFLEGIKFAY